MKVTATSKKVNIKSHNSKILMVTLCKFPQSPILELLSILLHQSEHCRTYTFVDIQYIT